MPSWPTRWRAVDPETAKDAVADTFLVAWRRLADVPEPARAWLLGVTRRTLSGHRRAHRRRRRLAERMAGTASASDPADGPLDAVTDRDAVTRALTSLRAADRELLCLIAWDGLTHGEAAAVLRCSPGAFAVRLHRARRRLEAALAEEDDLRGHCPAPIEEVPHHDA